MTVPDMRERLNAAMAPPDEHSLPAVDALEPETPWKIEDDQMASWALRKLREAADQVQTVTDAVQGLYAAELAKLDAWRDAELGAVSSEKRTVEFMTHHLTLYMRRHYADTGKSTLRLPGGTLSRTRSQSLKIDDAAMVIAWAHANGYPDMIKEEPSVEKIKKLLVTDDDGLIQPAISTGDIVPGIHIDVDGNYKVKPA